MKTPIRFLRSLGLLALTASVAFAVQAKFLCTFNPPADVAVNEPGVEYAIEAQQPDGTWLQVASGPAVPTGQASGSLSISYTSNVPFGPYVVRVRVIKPVLGPVSDNSNTEIVAPGKPTDVKIQGNRSGPPVAPSTSTITRSGVK